MQGRNTSLRPPLSSLAWTAALVLFAGALGVAQSAKQAPAGAPSTGRVATAGEPGRVIKVSGLVVDSAGATVRDASIYAYQTDAEGYYGVKPASDSQNPRLKIFLRSDALGAWSFDTIKPGSYPNGSIPAHIHFEVSAAGRSTAPPPALRARTARTRCPSTRPILRRSSGARRAA